MASQKKNKNIRMVETIVLKKPTIKTKAKKNKRKPDVVTQQIMAPISGGAIVSRRNLTPKFSTVGNTTYVCSMELIFTGNVSTTFSVSQNNLGPEQFPWLNGVIQFLQVEMGCFAIHLDT